MNALPVNCINKKNHITLTNPHMYIYFHNYVQTEEKEYITIVVFPPFNLIRGWIYCF